MDARHFTAFLAAEPDDDQYQRMGDWLAGANLTITFGRAAEGEPVAEVDPHHEDFSVKTLVNEAVGALTEIGLRPVRLEPADLEAFLDAPLR